MRKSLENYSCFKEAASILKDFEEDDFFQKRLKSLHEDCRLKYFVEEYPKLKNLNNFERNWLLYSADEIVDLNLCPLFIFSESRIKQYCNPEFEESDVTELVIQISNSSAEYCLDRLETNCDLLKQNKCKKMMIFK